MKASRSTEADGWRTKEVVKKLIRDIVTSSSYMYERLAEQYKAVNAALCFMDRSELSISECPLKQQVLANMTRRLLFILVRFSS